MTYFSSGATPQRRDFSFPQNLTSTRPHSDLLDEYRTNVRSMFMDDLPELPEADKSELMVRVHDCCVLCVCSQ